MRKNKERLARHTDTSLERWQVQYTIVQTAERDMKANMTNLRKNMSDAKNIKVFDYMMKRGTIREAARIVTQRKRGGVMTPDDIDE